MNIICPVEDKVELNCIEENYTVRVRLWTSECEWSQEVEGWLYLLLLLLFCERKLSKQMGTSKKVLSLLKWSLEKSIF